MKKEQLKQWRKNMGLTQVQIGQLIGYKRWSIMKWEQGVVKIPLRAQKLILSVIGDENETARKALSNRGNVSQGKAVSRHRQGAGIKKGVRVKKVSD